MENEKPLQFDDCEDAVVGVVLNRDIPLVVYDYDRLCAVFTAQGMDEHEAAEWVAHNILCLHAGPGTPIVIQFGDWNQIESFFE